MTEADEAAALAAQIQDQIRELRGQLACVEAAIARLEGDSTGPVMTVLLEVKRLRLEVKQLGEKLAEATRKRKAADPQAPYWLGLRKEEHATRLAEVRAWVDRVALVQYPTYFARLPPCWASHADLVLEVSNVMTEWARVYGDTDNRPLEDALWFHERWLPGLLARCEKWFRCDVTGCRLARSSPWERAPPRY